MEVIKHDDTGFLFNKSLKFSGYKDMKLISLGTRYKYLLTIYGVGFYDENYDVYDLIIKETYNEVYNLKYSKILLLQFYRNVTSERMVNSIKKHIGLRNVNNDKEINDSLEKLEELLTTNIENINYKDLIHIVWDNNLIYIHYNNKLLGTIYSKKLMDLILRCYLDEETIISNIREKLLDKTYI